VKGCVTSRTSHLRQDVASESWMILLVYRTLWYNTHGASNGEWCRPTAAGVHTRNPRHRQPCHIKCVKSYQKFVLCLKVRSVGYTADCKGEVKSCDVIFEGVQSNVTKGQRRYFFSIIAWHHLWTTPYTSVSVNIEVVQFLAKHTVTDAISAFMCFNHALICMW